MQNDRLLFADEVIIDKKENFWKVLIVDDEKDVHTLTQTVLSNFTFLDKKIKFFNAYGEKDAMDIMKQEKDIALVLLDIVMEDQDSGLKIAKAIREELENKFVRIIIRTGQPGITPEVRVIVDYDINDYKEKTELTSDKLFSTVVTALRGYNDLCSLDEKENMLISQSRQAIMGEMISMIAHQWRQPLGIISVLANNISISAQFDNLDIKKLDDIVRKIQQQTSYLSNTIDDFRNFFSPSKKKESVVIDEVLDDTLKLIEKSLESINIVRKYNSKSKINIYSKELMQVIINIIRNAQDALVEKGIQNPYICIKTKEDAAYLYLSVCDNAGGISPDIIDKIFDPYFTTKDARNGTGLGLHIAKTIIKKHLLGTIEVKNNADGVCFNITIPFLK